MSEDNVYQLKLSPEHFLRNYFGDKFIVLSMDKEFVTYCLGDVTVQELSFLRTVIDHIIKDKMEGGK